MRRLLTLLVVVTILAGAAGSCMAAITWSKVGTSGFSTDPALLNDRDRIPINSIAVDNAGNVYVAANNAENGTYRYSVADNPTNPSTLPPFTAKAGGVTVFSSAGTKLYDINVSDAVDAVSPWSTLQWGASLKVATYGARNDSKMAGAITKLVKAGDGKIYALLNWLEVNWSYQRQNQRIVRINANGTVEAIWAPMAPVYPGLGFGGSGPKQLQSCAHQWGTAWGDTRGSIKGLTVGGDGNLYWVMNGEGTEASADDRYWRVHWFWKYDVASGVASESLPNDTAIGMNADGKGWGLGVASRMFDIEYVGNGRFAKINQSGGYDSQMSVDALHFNDPMMRATVTNGGSRYGGFLRDWATATAYDTERKNLWIGGRSGGQGPWTTSVAGSGNSTSLVTISGTNKGIKVLKPTTGEQNYFGAPATSSDRSMTIGAGFIINSISNCDQAILLINAPAGASGKQPSGAVRINGSGQFELIDPISGSMPKTILATFGSAVVGVPQTIYLAADSDTGMLTCWYNGAVVYDAMATCTQGSARAWFGSMYKAGGFQFGTATGGSIDVTFDWVGFTKKRVAPGEGWDTTVLGNYLDGSAYPDQLVRMNMVTRFQGNDPNGMFSIAGSGTTEDPYTYSLPVRNFDGLSPHPYSPNADNIAANGNNPAASLLPVAGHYWINTMAVNPGDGSCWTSWSADANYVYGDRGHVFALGPGAWEVYDLGGVAANTDVKALAFSGSTAYALTVNRTTGVYDLYKATDTSSSNYYTPTTIAGLKDGAGAKRGVMVSIDNPVVVTFSDDGADYFYVEEVDANGIPVAGIKVISGDPAWSDMPAVGTKVTFHGFVEISNGEAQFRAWGINTDAGGNPDPTPLTMLTKSAGGAAAAVQPGVSPFIGANNVGLLVKMAARVKAANNPLSSWMMLPFFTVNDGTSGVTYYVDDNATVSPLDGIKIAFDPSFVGVAEGDFVTVVGVVSTEVISANPADPTLPKTYQRVIRPRTTDDIVVFSGM